MRSGLRSMLSFGILFHTSLGSGADPERNPADAYGGGNSAPQPLTPEAAREVFRIPVPIASGPFDGTWKSFTPDKLKPEPDWWREAKIGVWFHWGPQSMGRNGDWYARFLYQQPPEGRKGRANNRWMYDEHLKRFGHPSEFGYMDVLNVEDNTYYSARPMVLQMIEAISRDGNFNINISLTPEGALEPAGEKMWREFGAFLRTNASAIYGSRAWKVLGEGRMAKNRRGVMELVTFPRSGILPVHDAFEMTPEDIRFTEGRDGAIHAFILTVPEPGQKLVIRSFGTDAQLLDRPIAKVSAHGFSGDIEWEQQADGLNVKFPENFTPAYSAVFRIELRGAGRPKG